MALIKCPDCGKMFSEYAECCPDCGCPTKDAKAANIVNDSPIPQPTEEVGSNEQALSIIDEKSVEGKTELQQDLQPSTEEDESIVEEKNPNLNAQIVADQIAKQIENRANFRTVQKKAIKDVMKAGAVGVKTAVSGRLGGAEMARTEGYTEGTVPLHTIRADIDYATSTAPTTYGKIGVKVWIYKGEILPTKNTNGGVK